VSNFTRFWEQMGKREFTPDFNPRLEAVMRNGKTAKERYWAWIKRYSWGQHEVYCCAGTRNGEHGPDPEPLNQKDASEAINTSEKTISLLTRAAIREGTLQADAKGRIVPVAEPGEIVHVDPEPNESWAADSSRWRAHFPLRFERREELRAVVAAARPELRKIDNEEKAYVRRLRNMRARSGNSSETPVSGGLFDSGNEAGADSGNGHPTHSGKTQLPTPVTPSESPNIGTRALNNKQQQQAPSLAPPADDVVVVVNKFRKYGSVSEEHARKFLELCAVSAGLDEGTFCRVEDVVAVIDRIGATLSESVRNKAGVLLKAVPPAMLAYIANKNSPQAMAASATNGRERAQPREATPEEIEEHKARGTYVPPRRK